MKSKINENDILMELMNGPATTTELSLRFQSPVKTIIVILDDLYARNLLKKDEKSNFIIWTINESGAMPMRTGD